MPIAGISDLKISGSSPAVLIAVLKLLGKRGREEDSPLNLAHHEMEMRILVSTQVGYLEHEIAMQLQQK